MTIEPEVIVELLRSAWPDVEVGTPIPLTGGFWASMFRVPLTGHPDGVPDEVVVRLAPSADMGAKEAEVQRAVATQGFATPQVRLSRADDSGAGWWSIMDFSPGTPLLAETAPVKILKRAPFLLRGMPRQLGQAMAALHSVDPGPVSAAVGDVAPDVAWSVAEVLDQFRLGAKATERSDLARALDVLGRRIPPAHHEVLCHGDFHPLNVLDVDGEFVVLDWTGAVVADPCFDLAFTTLLLGNPPLAMPGPLTAVVRRMGRTLANRFLAAYRDANPHASLEALEWYRALHGARALVEVATLQAKLGPDAGGHPFTMLAPVAARNLTKATGVSIAPMSAS